ncbi:universal stress protein [Kitasatospora viridis]|uniref:Nucleotide-binding universal stress UspA family protein n=1 Tax=Kitasatospora viridis TaxID=281105 RepID=A0A561UPF6_9ACTN|nr:universal stress protein [Kitasatospora viridis]TWG01230.1 nucleotide-binding universal stress UspA family protein [Kitasatospora viridis]
MTAGVRVVVGVGSSLSALAAVHRAVREARMRHAVLVPVVAWQPGDEPLRPLSELAHAARQRLDTAFEQAFGGWPDDLLLHPEVVRADPGQALVAAADRPSDLLVVGAGRPGRAASVARYCRARAGCPVLVVPAGDLLDEPDSGIAPAHCRMGLAYQD